MSLHALLNTPWAITEQGIEALYALLKRDGKPLENTRTASVRDGVAVIPIRGPLCKEDSFIGRLFGLSSYEGLRKDFEEAATNPAVNAVVLDVDSPGGEVHGVSELSKAIFDARGTKPIVAYVGGMGCSAAYWLSSACDRIVVDGASMVGSIGVRTMLVDDSKRDEMAGVKEYQIVSSQSPYKVVNAGEPSDRARVRASMDSLATVFVSDVARNRKVTSSKVLKDFGQGDVFIGADAVAAGLADSVGTLESVIASLSSDASPKRGSAMAKASKTGANMGAAKCDGCSRDMEDDDEMYCRACHAEASFEREVFSLVGAKDKATAVGTIAALVAERAKSAELASKLAALEAEKTKADVASLLEGAIKDRRLPPAKKADMEKLAGKYGVDALKAALSAMVPVVGSAEQAPRENPAVADGGIELTAEEIRVARTFAGGDPVALEARLKAMRDLKAMDQRSAA